MSISISAEAGAYNRTLGLGSQTQISMCGWFNLTTDRNTNQIPLGVFNANTDYIAMGTTTDGVTWRGFDEGAQTANGQAMTVGTWYFGALSVNGASGNLWTRADNSTTYTTLTWTTFSANTNAATLYVGRHAATGLWWAGKVAAVKLWVGKTLTLADFQNESTTFQPQTVQNLRAWYPFLGTQTEDWSGNGNTLTAGSAVSDTSNPSISWGNGAYQIIMPATPTNIPISLSDAGTGADSLAIAGTASATDSASGSEILAVASSTPLSDLGSSAESLTASVALALSDTASATETISVTRFIPFSDTASSTEQLTATVALSLADAGTSSEALATNRTVVTTDSGSSTDTLATNASTPLTEIAHATESLAVAATITLSDSAIASESLSVTVTTALLFDTASATEALAESVTTSIADTASASDQLASSANVLLGDSASASETFLQGALKLISDSGTTQESVSVSVALGLAETALAHEALVLIAPVLVALTDSGTSIEHITLNGNTPTVGFMAIGDLKGSNIARAYKETSSSVSANGSASKASRSYMEAQKIKVADKSGSRMQGKSGQGPSIGGNG